MRSIALTCALSRQTTDREPTMDANRTIRILHVISQRPDSTGSGIYLQALLKQSARHGYDNALVAAIQADWSPAPSGIKVENCHLVEFAGGSCPETIVGMSDVMPYPSRKFQDLDPEALKRYLEMFTGQLSRAVSAYQPDIIHSHHLWLLSSIIKKHFPDIPLITSCHGSDLRQFKLCTHLRDQVREGCSNIDRILALSAEQRDEIIVSYQFPGNKIDIAGAGYDTDIFHAGAGSEEPENDNILYAGKLSRAKGVPWLLRAVGEITHHRCHLHLVGGGSGAELQECITAAAALAASCSRHGRGSQPELSSLMRRSSIFILPSLHEGLPLVVLEALACGCTVIATDLPGTREIQKHLKTRQLLLIKKPTVVDTDATLLADEQQFVASLRLSLEQVLGRQKTGSLKQSDLSYFSWESVFRRIEKSWLKILD